jgi:hypothetical protein
MCAASALQSDICAGAADGVAAIRRAQAIGAKVRATGA